MRAGLFHGLCRINYGEKVTCKTYARLAGKTCRGNQAEGFLRDNPILRIGRSQLSQDILGEIVAVGQHPKHPSSEYPINLLDVDPPFGQFPRNVPGQSVPDTIAGTQVVRDVLRSVEAHDVRRKRPALVTSVRAGRRSRQSRIPGTPTVRAAARSRP